MSTSYINTIPDFIKERASLIKKGDTYSIYQYAGCSFIYGSFPVQDFVNLPFKEDDVANSHLSLLCHATFVIGSKKELNNLFENRFFVEYRRHLVTTRLNELNIDNHHTLFDWLCFGFKNESTKAISNHHLGVKYWREIDKYTHPKSLSDIKEVIGFVNTYPELMSTLENMGKSDAVWKKVVDNWYHLQEIVTKNDYIYAEGEFRKICFPHLETPS